MTKKLKIYQILTFALGLAFVGLCLFVGITAVQKSMKLNLSFTANPIVFCQVLVNEEVIFDNSEKIIDDGVSLSGNVLTFNSTVSENVTLGESFDLQIKNYSTTGSAIHISFNGATISTGDVVNSTSYSEIIASNNFSEVLSVSTNEMEISMTKVTPVTLSLGAGVTLTSSNILTSTSGAQCLPFGEDLQATISLESSYENPKFTFNGNTYDITDNQLTIPTEDLTGGNANVEIEAEQSSYTLTLKKEIITTSSGFNYGFGVIATNDPNFNIHYTVSKLAWVSNDSNESEIEFPTTFTSGMTPIKDQYPNSQFKYVEYYNTTTSETVSHDLQLPKGYRVFVFTSAMWSGYDTSNNCDYLSSTYENLSVVNTTSYAMFYFEMPASALEVCFCSYRQGSAGAD